MSEQSTAAFISPRSLAEALELLACEPRPVVLAGGTDLWPQWNAGLRKPPAVLSLHQLAELRTIELACGELRLGACVTHARLAGSTEVRQACPSLAEAAATIGAVQVQNRGTLGGNLVNASPAADLPPALLAAGARVELSSRAGGIRQVSLQRFFTGYRTLDRRPDELLVAVLVPALPHGAIERFRKVGTRRAQAISKVVGCCRLEPGPEGTFARAGIAFGSVGPTVVQLEELQRWLVGRKPVRETAEEAGRLAEAAVQPIDDLRSTAEYRGYLVGRLVYRWILQAFSI